MDAQYGNEIQKIMYGDIQPENLNTFEHNLSHSEQRMMLYILQKLQKGEKIDKIVMFTGRKCCPVCHEALPKFMEHIKNKYGDLVPKTMTVYDFWNEKEYDGDKEKRGYCNNNYYAYGSDEGVNYKSVFDENLTEIEKQHLVEFVSKINNHRCIGTDNTIGDWFYTVESLKGDSSIPIVFSVEELKEICNNRITYLNEQIEIIKSKKEITKETRQLLNKILQQNDKKDKTTSKSQKIHAVKQNELNTDNLEEIVSDIEKIIQQDVEEIKKQKDKIIIILDQNTVETTLKEIQQNSEKAIQQQGRDKKITEEEHDEILKTIQTKKETLKQHVIRYKQSTIALKTLQERQSSEYFNFQNYLKKTFAIDNISTNTQLHLPPSNTDGTLSKSVAPK